MSNIRSLDDDENKEYRPQSYTRYNPYELEVRRLQNYLDLWILWKRFVLFEKQRLWNDITKSNVAFNEEWIIWQTLLQNEVYTGYKQVPLDPYTDFWLNICHIEIKKTALEIAKYQPEKDKYGHSDYNVLKYIEREERFLREPISHESDDPFNNRYEIDQMWSDPDFPKEALIWLKDRSKIDTTNYPIDYEHEPVGWYKLISEETRQELRALDLKSRRKYLHNELEPQLRDIGLVRQIHIDPEFYGGEYKAEDLDIFDPDKRQVSEFMWTNPTFAIPTVPIRRVGTTYADTYNNDIPVLPSGRRNSDFSTVNEDDYSDVLPTSRKKRWWSTK